MRIYRFIYKTTNLINGNYYIGKHTTTNINDKYLGSGIVLKRAIRKYGKDNFKRETLVFRNSEEEILALERLYITPIQVKDSNCYNLILGGCGNGQYGKLNGMYGKTSYNKGQKNCPVMNVYLSMCSYDRSGKNNPFYGKTHTEETKMKISKAASERIGEKNHFYGKTHTKESKVKMSESTKERFKNNPELGLRISELRRTGWWYTPYGIFKTSVAAAKVENVTKATVRARCKKNLRLVSKKYNNINNTNFVNKTWKDIGYKFVPFGEESNESSLT